MNFRDIHRREYLRQPHILLIIATLLIVLIAAIVTGVKRINQMQRAANADTYNACMEYVADDVLCQFASNNEIQSSRNTIVTTTTTNGDTTEVSTLEIESPDRMKSVTLDGLKETEAYIVLDNETYVKDYSDNIWAKYTDPEFAPSETSLTYNFSSANAADVIELRDHYSSMGTEPCGDRTCYKYEVTSDTEASYKTYVWIDTEDFLLRRFLVSNPEMTTNTQFSYQSVTVTAPSEVKEVSQEEIEAYL